MGGRWGERERERKKRDGEKEPNIKREDLDLKMDGQRSWELRDLLAK